MNEFSGNSAIKILEGLKGGDEEIRIPKTTKSSEEEVPLDTSVISGSSAIDVLESLKKPEEPEVSETEIEEKETVKSPPTELAKSFLGGIYYSAVAPTTVDETMHPVDEEGRSIGIGKTFVEKPSFEKKREEELKKPITEREFRLEPVSKEEDYRSSNIIRKAIYKINDLLGTNIEPKLSDEARTMAFLEYMAKQEGMTLSEYIGPNPFGQLSEGFVGTALGPIMAIHRELTGERPIEPSTPLEGVMRAAGSIGGAALWMNILGKPLGLVTGFLPKVTAETPKAVRIVTSMIKSGIDWGAVGGVISIGEAVREPTMAEAAKHIAEESGTSAVLGGIIGATKGVFPVKDLDRVKRLATGLIGINAFRAYEYGLDKYFNRPVSEFAFDTFLDTWMLWNGLPKGKFDKVTKDVLEISENAREYVKRKEAVKDIPDERIKQAQEKILEVEKAKIENAYNKLMKNVGDDVEVAFDLFRQYEDVVKEQLRPVAKSGLKKPGKRVEKTDIKKLKPEYSFISKKGNKYVKKGNVWYDSEGKVVRNSFIIKAAEAKKVKVQEVEKPSVEEPKETTEEVVESVEKPKEIKEVKESEGIEEPKETKQGPDIVSATEELINVLKKDIDPPTEAPSGAQSPFYFTPERLERSKKIIEGKSEHEIRTDPNLYLHSLITKFNRWVKGDKSIDVGEVRKSLSMLSAYADEFKKDFNTEDAYYMWKHTAKEASIWANRTDRLIIKQTEGKKSGESKGVRLNLGVPIDEVPKEVKKLAKSIKKSGKSLYRNYKIWKETGFWLGKDGKWRYAVPTDDLFVKVKSVEEFRKTEGKLKDLVNEDAEIFKAVPELKDLNVKIDKRLKPGTGYYNDVKKTIVLSELKDFEVLDHEIGHAINDLRGSSFLGTSPEWQRGKLRADAVRHLLFKILPEAKTSEIRSKILDFINETYEETYSGKISRIDLVERAKRKYAHELSKAGDQEAAKKLRGLSDISKKEAEERYLTDQGEMESRLFASYIPQEYPKGKYGSVPPWKFLDDMLEEEGLGKRHGIRLYSGPPVDLIYKYGKEYTEAFLKDWKAAKEQSKLTRGDIIRGFTEATFNTAFQLRRDLKKIELSGKGKDRTYKVLQMHVNSAGGHGYGGVLYKQMKKEVARGLDKNKTRILNQLIRGQRFYDISKYKSMKFPKHQDYKRAISYEAVFKDLEGLTEKEAADLIRRRDLFFDWMKRIVDDLEKDEIITKEMAEGLRSHDYAKLKGIGQRLEKEGEGITVEDLFDEKEYVKVGNRLRPVASSGIERLRTGKSSDILDPDQIKVASEIFSRAYGRIFRNRVFKALADLGKEFPDNGIVKLPGLRDPKTGEVIKVGDTRGYSKFYFREGGKKRTIYVSDDYMRSLDIAGTDVSPRMINVNKYLLLTNVAKVFHTGITPFWNLCVNLPLDIMGTYFSQGIYRNGRFERVYSWFPVKFAGQILKDYIDTADVLVRGVGLDKSPKYKKSAERGLLMPFFATQGKLSNTYENLSKAYENFETIAGYISESVELWTRMANVNRVVKLRAKEKGISVEEAWNDPEILDEAVFSARDRMDFSQGGWFIKAADKGGMIYLNSGAQATRTFFRSLAENNPGEIAKIITTFGVPVVLSTMAGLLYAPKTHRDIPKYQDYNYLNVPLSDKLRTIDPETGEEIGFYISVPIGSGPAFLKNLFQALTEKFAYDYGITKEPPNYEAIVGSLKASMPDVMSLPPGFRAFIEYTLNINTWSGKSPSAQKFRYPYSAAEYTPGRTPQVAIDVGEKTGLSPDRLTQSMRDIFGHNTVWTYGFTEGYEQLFGGGSEDEKEEMMEGIVYILYKLSKLPGAGRWIRIARPGTGYRDEEDKKHDEIMAERFQRTKAMDFLAKQLYWRDVKEAKGEMKELFKEVKDPDEIERLRNRALFIRSIKPLKHKSMWIRALNKPAEERAFVVYNRLKQAVDEEERKEIWREANYMNSGIYGTKNKFFGGDFIEEYGKLVRREKERERKEKVNSLFND